MALRLEDDLHAQLSVLATLSDTSIAELIRRAIDAYLESKRSDPALAAQAESVLADIDQAAKTRRDAIAGLFATRDESSDEQPKLAPVPDTSKRGSSRKGGT
jgi:predicted transcriptional regulator